MRALLSLLLHQMILMAPSMDFLLDALNLNHIQNSVGPGGETELQYLVVKTSKGQSATFRYREIAIQIDHVVAILILQFMPVSRITKISRPVGTCINNLYNL